MCVSEVPSLHLARACSPRVTCCRTALHTCDARAPSCSFFPPSALKAIMMDAARLQCTRGRRVSSAHIITHATHLIITSASNSLPRDRSTVLSSSSPCNSDSHTPIMRNTCKQRRPTLANSGWCHP